MKKAFRKSLHLLIFTLIMGCSYGQRMQMGEVLVVNNVKLKKDVRPDSLKSYYYKEIAPDWNKPSSGNGMFLFKADRGDRKGSYLLVCTSRKTADRQKLPSGSPFTDQVLSGGADQPIKLSNFITNSEAYTEYRLIGARQFNTLPIAGVLGMHYIKVKKDSLKSFEQFVREKLNPTVGHLLPDLQLLYFKATAGEKAGSYLLIFALKSPAARASYWPEGAPEKEALKQAFLPLKETAKELGSYLVENSYLKPESGGAAAYFESLEWTDYVN